MSVYACTLCVYICVRVYLCIYCMYKQRCAYVCGESKQETPQRTVEVEISIHMLGVYRYIVCTYTRMRIHTCRYSPQHICIRLYTKRSLHAYLLSCMGHGELRGGSRSSERDRREPGACGSVEKNERRERSGKERRERELPSFPEPLVRSDGTTRLPKRLGCLTQLVVVVAKGYLRNEEGEALERKKKGRADRLGWEKRMIPFFDTCTLSRIVATPSTKNVKERGVQRRKGNRVKIESVHASVWRAR